MITVKTPTFIACVTFSVYAAVGGELTPLTVFSTLTHISFLRYTFIHFILGLLQVSEAYVGYKRIKVKVNTMLYFYVLYVAIFTVA